MSIINYSSVYSIKDFAANELIPKYFRPNDINELNIGLLGYATELITNTAEDGFNTVSVLMNEMFPNLAILPETIYNYAALFQITDIFASAASMDMMLFVSETDILQYASRVTDSAGGTQGTELFEFFLDSDTIVDVEGVQFLMDYDVKINYKPYRNDYIFTATYNMRRHGANFENAMSIITNPYIRVKRVTIEGEKYIALFNVKMHQINRYTLTESILTNDVVNLPTITVPFEGDLADINIFYRAPGDTRFTQLIKKLDGSTPLREPFCYYRFKNDNRVDITFTSRDGYFNPEFNAEIYIDYCVTQGEGGNFPLYKGTNITVQPSSDVYDYNNHIIIFALPQTESLGGTARLSLEQLKNLVIEKFSTVDSYTTEQDLQLYFSNINREADAMVKFVKKRDDAFQRLFTAFMFFKDSSNDIFHTNTLNIHLDTDEFDYEEDQSDAYILKPGRLFTYLPNSITDTEIRPGTATNIGDLTDQFIYTNPLLIYFVKDPIMLGYYLNTINTKHVVDYTYMNDNSLVQFICNTMSIRRNAVIGEDTYTITVSVTPTTILDNPIVTEIQDPLSGEITYEFSDSLRIRMAIEDSDSGNEIVYRDFTLTEWDLTNNIYTYECDLQTNDHITLNNKMLVTNVYTMDSTPLSYDNTPKVIPMIDCVLNIHMWYRYSEFPPNVPVALDPVAPLSLTNYVKTNTYSTDSEPVTFIYPIKMMRSTARYTYNGDGVIGPTGLVEGGTYSIDISSVPLIEYSIMNNESVANEFLYYLKSQYTHIENIVNKITNNYAIDMKFYNTYGRSRNFTIGDAGETLLDRVNIDIHIQVRLLFGTSEEELIRDLKIYIKNYIETINEGGTNAFYVSNLIQAIENDFEAVKYMKFVSINGLDSSIQVIETTTEDLTTLSKQERMTYTPEYLTIRVDDINIEVI